MENNVQVFDNPEFGSLRTIEIDSVIWFVGIDVTAILGYGNSRQALKTNVDSEDKKTVHLLDGNKRGNPNKVVINESGLYSLILSSKLPSAKKFKHWVTSEVLPAVRKHGVYMTADTIEKILSDPDTIIKIAKQLKAEQEKNRVLTITNAALTEETERWDAKSIINALVRKYSSVQCKGNFAMAWNIFYKRLSYKGHINLKIRRGKSKSKQPLIDMLESSEYPLAIKIATAMCEQVNIDTGEVINEVNNATIA